MEKETPGVLRALTVKILFSSFVIFRANRPTSSE